jgi:hypothetical protein
MRKYLMKARERSPNTVNDGFQPAKAAQAQFDLGRSGNRCARSIHVQLSALPNPCRVRHIPPPEAAARDDFQGFSETGRIRIK